MVKKLEYLGANKRQQNLRVYMTDVISKVDNFEYIDNSNIQNKFHENDHKIKKTTAK